MTPNANANANSQTPHSTHLSIMSSTTTISPTWAPPKSPLPPHRLAKLANALGVSTPMPAVHQPTPSMSRSYLDSPATTDISRRSPTPSTPGSTFAAYSPAVSKYLLHVIPPLHLPHDTDTDITLPPPNASGYHTQFRRGTLVPVHSNLQSQLCAIAKEYALPSTAGLILYLVSSAKSPQLSPTPGMQEYDVDEPGPRLSEDIWRHLWTRVLSVEQRDDVLMPRSPLGMTLGAQSTPYLNEFNGQPLRPFLSSKTDNLTITLPSGPFPPSPTTPSTVSDPRSNTRSTPPSESSAYDPETPDTSSAAPSILKDPESHANSLDLPGLMSPSLIPILAKVEFDIDHRKAAWYEPWIRSRRMNHAKRAESRNGRQGSRGDTEEASNGSQELLRPIDLLTGNKEAQSAVSLLLSPTEETLVTEPEPIAASPSEGYQQLDDGESEEEEEQEEEEQEEEEQEEEEQEEEEQEEEEEDKEGQDDDDEDQEQHVGELVEELEDDHEEDGGWSDDSDDEDFESTARVATLTQETHKDALADIFGTDAETWAELKNLSPRDSNRNTNPNVVDLALTAADLTALPSPTRSEFETLGKEEDEVQALLEQMSRSSIPASVPSSPTSPTAGKKHVPPPLTLVINTPPQELVVPSDPMPPSSDDSSGLAYLDQSPAEPVDEAVDEEEFETEYTRVKSPAESEKRGGAVFDDLDLGLDPTEDYDDNDPHDRRRSQFLMMAQLDEIERTMAQFSPRMLSADLADEHQTYLPLSPNNSMTLSPGKMNADYYPPSPRLPQHPGIPDSPLLTRQAAWPATPFASIKNTSPTRRKDAPPSPPRLALNGITTSAPKSYMPNSSGEMSAESESRKRELEEQQGFRQPPKANVSTDSPLIPLSPDPFGRFSSTIPDSSASRQTSAYWEEDNVPAIISTETPPPIVSPEGRKRSNSSATSRFSADSITGIESNSNTNGKSNRATLITVNAFKKLWRKSTKNTSSNPPPSTPSPVPPVPGRPGRPSQEQSDEPPKTPILGRLSPQPVPPRRSQDALPPVPQAPQLSVAPQQPQKPIPQPPSQPPNVPQQSPRALTPPVPTPHQRSPIPHPQQLTPVPPQRSPIPYGQHQHQHSMSSAHPQQQGPIPQQQNAQSPFNGRNANPQPIVATQMRPSRSNSTLDRFQFDQESPYPITRRPINSRTASPPPVPSPNLQTTHLPPPMPPSMYSEDLPPLTAPPEKPTARKSILKGWKSASISSTASTQPPVGVAEPRSSIERPNAGGVRTKRPGVLNFGSSRTSVSSPPPDIPPSPQIPQQFISHGDNRQSIRSKLTSSSFDSSHSPPHFSAPLTEPAPRRSMASSRSSQDSRPSFDTSQFEIVSPKMGSALSYPYHGLDHSTDSSIEGR
ncbi:hypothetical protein C0991_007525 [Blastosporella zonata]|nr:hypothetical protein C0991_007525 [Blastosporella zonata]